MIEIGKKSNDSESGYVWMPYIMANTTSNISGDFTPSRRIRKRKIDKIKKILERIEDFNITSG
jgi:hypothetical protein